MTSKKSAKLKVSLLCGGPSLERGISLNSARSVMDHLCSEKIEVFPLYFDAQKKAYKISKAQLYSNTPSDFDFKIRQKTSPLTERELAYYLKTKDITFPVIHGSFGEDGKLQKILERDKIPFVGSGSQSSKKAFDKFRANNFIRKKGFFTFPSAVLKIYHRDHKKIIDEFFLKNRIKRAVVKPASGGSSIGVFSVSNPKEALEKATFLFSRRMDSRVVIEPFARGIEFTVIILENRFGLPVALLPTEIETDYTKHQIFDFRKKYLPTRQVTWHCPPRFNKKTTEKIQAQGEQLFSLFKMHDFARFDGWVLPDGNIWFCDFNPISGMEQNSFLFQQASQIGMTHHDTLNHIVKRACDRQKVFFPENDKKKKKSKRKEVNIIMGGDNSERQVSLMSGTNVWLKLRQSERYKPQLFLLDNEKNIWKLPYHLSLNHTVEEIKENCEKYHKIKEELSEFERRARLRLGLSENKNKEEFFDPQKITFQKFLDISKFIFIALHGGRGEDGTLQNTLFKNRIRYNGPDEKVSALCMNKEDTAHFIKNLGISGVDTIPGKSFVSKKILELGKKDTEELWKKIKRDLPTKTVIVKPLSDGCTTGIARLCSSNDLFLYIDFMRKGKSFIPKETLSRQAEIIEMPTSTPTKLLFEKFIETDILRVKANKLKHRYKKGLVEITVGVLEKESVSGRTFQVKSLNPSITISEGEVLTVEEKFQGGTGINITPPPESIVKARVLKKIKKRIEKLSQKIGINGYSRIDAFLDIKSGKLLIIEINTLPGLTPSTVFYHQCLAEKPPIFPKEFLETVIKNKGY